MISTTVANNIPTRQSTIEDAAHKTPTTQENKSQSNSAAAFKHRFITALPYLTKTVLQTNIASPEGTMTSTETQRLLGLRGSDGLIACRIASGWSTLPRIQTNGRIKLATRGILRLNNVTVFRGPPQSQNLKESMIGPNHYFGVLDNTHKYTCQLIKNENDIPQFIKTKNAPEQTFPNKKLEAKDMLTIDASWISGRNKENKETIATFLKKHKPTQERSLTDKIGVLLLNKTEYTLPTIDATKYDLSDFGVKLVKNDQPFRITKDQEDPMDVVTYHFGENYAEKILTDSNGLFLETHQFTQIISPMTSDSKGFITIGRWNTQGKLELIGVQVPYNYSIIVEKGTIHGDATFTGSYLMAMTVNHHTMGTADVLFIKTNNNDNVKLKQDSTPQPAKETTRSLSYTDKGIRPLAVMSETEHNGELKKELDNKIRDEKKNLDSLVLTGSSVILNPFNPAGSLIKQL